MPQIKTERLSLRSLTPDDALAFFPLASNLQIARGAGWQPQTTAEGAAELLQMLFADQPAMFGVFFWNKLIGTMGLREDDHRSGDNLWMINYALLPEYWGRGFAAEAARAVIQYAQEQLHPAWITGYCYSDNQRSAHLMEKCGLRYSGTLKHAGVRWDGTVYDECCYVL